jgi:hypothetical protein
VKLKSSTCPAGIKKLDVVAVGVPANSTNVSALTEIVILREVNAELDAEAVVTALVANLAEELYRVW